MFTRIVTTRAKAGKLRELSSALHDQVVPALRKQQGFVDLLTMSADNDPQRLVSVTTWKTREDAERYQRDQFPKISQMLDTLLDGEPEVQTGNVELSTAYRITAGKAA